MSLNHLVAEEYRAVVEFAPNQKIPSKQHRDSRTDSVFGCHVYMKFVQDLTSGTLHEAIIPEDNESSPATVNALLAHIRSKRMLAKGKDAMQSGEDNKKDGQKKRKIKKKRPQKDTGGNVPVLNAMTGKLLHPRSSFTFGRRMIFTIVS